MEYTIKTQPIEKTRCGCIIVGVFSNRQLTPSAARLDKASHGYIKKILRQGDLEKTFGQTLLLQQIPNVVSPRILLVNCGGKENFTPTHFKKIITKSIQILTTTPATNALSCLCEIPVTKHDLAWQLYQSVLATADTLYRFDELKNNTKKTPPHLRQLMFHVSENKKLNAAKQSLKTAQAVAEGIELTKNLGNLPANICTPTYLAKQAQHLSKQFKTIKTTVLNEADMKKLGMGALLSVSRGSKEPAKLIVLQYKGASSKEKPFAFVGKGITFDSGGISLKPSAAMDEMKYDMCGAASVLGTLQTCAKLALPVNVIGIIATSENLPGGQASKPGDIVKTMSGQTVEILNTDAEGRLVLCDALTYCKKFKPQTIIDIATLTGAMVIALGSHPTGMMSNNDKLANNLMVAGETSHDRVWRLPLWEEYQEIIDSRFADIANIGDRTAGSITAACFLARFTKDQAWAHLDIAGTAWKSGKEKGGTGRPVALLTQYLIDQSKQKK